MPILFGIVVGCVPKFAQATAAALFAIFFNVVSMGMAPIVVGSVVSEYKSTDQRQGMIEGYRVLLYTGIATPILLVFAKCMVNKYISQLESY